jgi:hypothetical protein
MNLPPEVVSMTQGKRVELSAAQRTDVWSRWKTGQSLHTIGRAFGKPHTSIHCLLAHHGGIVPAVRLSAVLRNNVRARLQFTLRDEGSCRKCLRFNPASVYPEERRAAGGRFGGLSQTLKPGGSSGEPLPQAFVTRASSGVGSRHLPQDRELGLYHGSKYLTWHQKCAIMGCV